MKIAKTYMNKIWNRKTNGKPQETEGGEMAVGHHIVGAKRVLSVAEYCKYSSKIFFRVRIEGVAIAWRVY